MFDNLHYLDISSQNGNSFIVRQLLTKHFSIRYSNKKYKYDYLCVKDGSSSSLNQKVQWLELFTVTIIRRRCLTHLNTLAAIILINTPTYCFWLRSHFLIEWLILYDLQHLFPIAWSPCVRSVADASLLHPAGTAQVYMTTSVNCLSQTPRWTTCKVRPGLRR